MGIFLSKTSTASRFVSGPEEVETGQEKSMRERTELLIQLTTSIPLPANHIEPLTRTFLESEIDGCEFLREAWHEAEEYYNNLSNKEDFDENALSREYYIALFTYVLDWPKRNPFYIKFNKLTRELKSLKDIVKYPYKYYYVILNRVVLFFGGVPMKMPRQVVEPLPTDNFKVYRGMNCRMEFNPEYCLVFQQFLSTTRSLEVAQRFTNPEGTLFIIEGLVPSGKVTTRGGSTVPVFAILDGIPEKIDQVQEYECLIIPTQPYRIKKIVKGNPDKIYLSL